MNQEQDLTCLKKKETEEEKVGVVWLEEGKERKRQETGFNVVVMEEGASGNETAET